jgi:predicted neuraminidase
MPVVLAMAGLAVAGWRAPRQESPRFALRAAAVQDQASAPANRIAPRAGGRAVDLPATVPSAHASTLAECPDGDLLAAWFAGTREGARDVAIHMARLSGGTVVDHWVTLTREELANSIHRTVRKLGNPVLWVSGDGAVHLFVTSVGIGGWSGSGITHLRSNDGGRSWSHARRLVLAPFLDLGTLVRTPPVPLEDGGVLLPCYREFIHKHGLAVRVAPDGRVVGSAPMPSAWRSLQPAVAATSALEAVAFLRCGDPSLRRVLRATTGSGGATWGAASPVDVANPDSSVALVRLDDGSLLMAANPSERGRASLALLRSTDGGSTWSKEAEVERGEEGSEFSYPTLVVARDGTVHLSYTLRRASIRLRSWTQAELGAGGANP